MITFNLLDRVPQMRQQKAGRDYSLEAQTAFEKFENELGINRDDTRWKQSTNYWQAANWKDFSPEQEKTDQLISSVLSQAKFFLIDSIKYTRRAIQSGKVNDSTFDLFEMAHRFATVNQPHILFNLIIYGAKEEIQLINKFGTREGDDTDLTKRIQRREELIKEVIENTSKMNSELDHMIKSGYEKAILQTCRKIEGLCDEFLPLDYREISALVRVFLKQKDIYKRVKDPVFSTDLFKKVLPLLSFEDVMVVGRVNRRWQKIAIRTTLTGSLRIGLKIINETMEKGLFEIFKIKNFDNTKKQIENVMNFVNQDKDKFKQFLALKKVIKQKESELVEKEEKYSKLLKVDEASRGKLEKLTYDIGKCRKRIKELRQSNLKEELSQLRKELQEMMEEKEKVRKRLMLLAIKIFNESQNLSDMCVKLKEQKSELAQLKNVVMQNRDKANEMRLPIFCYYRQIAQMRLSIETDLTRSRLKALQNGVTKLEGHINCVNLNTTYVEVCRIHKLFDDVYGEMEFIFDQPH